MIEFDSVFVNYLCGAESRLIQTAMCLSYCIWSCLAVTLHLLLACLLVFVLFCFGCCLFVFDFGFLGLSVLCSFNLSFYMIHFLFLVYQLYYSPPPFFLGGAGF